MFVSDENPNDGTWYTKFLDLISNSSFLKFFETKPMITHGESSREPRAFEVYNPYLPNHQKGQVFQGYETPIQTPVKKCFKNYGVMKM